LTKNTQQTLASEAKNLREIKKFSTFVTGECSLP